MNKFKSLTNYGSFNILLSLFVILLLWRFVLLVTPSLGTDINIQIWAASYQIVAWFGAITGFIFAKKWGGFKSLLGRTALAFSFGLLAQSFGQSVFSWYFYTGNELPFPSIADIGYFGSIPFYIYGISSLAKIVGSKYSLRSSINRVWAIVIPVAILIASYFEFLKGYEFSQVQPNLTDFLNFGYPLGQAIYISIAILAFLFSRNSLGGIMKSAMMMFIIALSAQFIADYSFLYLSMKGLFVGGGVVDCLYLVAYFLMALSLIRLGIVFHEINNGQDQLAVEDATTTQNVQ